MIPYSRQGEFLSAPREVHAALQSRKSLQLIDNEKLDYLAGSHLRPKESCNFYQTR
jgi:hypothetical protein